MKFPYREYIAWHPETNDYRLFVRPVISLRIAGTTSSARWDALVDTGADETLLPISFAPLLGVEFDQHMTSEAAGITGDRLKIHYGDVDLRIEQGDENATWRTTVGFVEFGAPDDELVILGHGGCLDYFSATFDGENAELELRPNVHLPSSPHSSFGTE